MFQLALMTVMIAPQRLITPHQSVTTEKAPWMRGRMFSSLHKMSTVAHGRISLPTAWCCCWESWCIALFSWCCLLLLGSLVHWLKNTHKALSSYHHVWQWGCCSWGWRLLLFHAKWKIHHCGQTITFLFHLTIKQKTRSLLLCPDEHLQTKAKRTFVCLTWRSDVNDACVISKQEKNLQFE